MRNNVEIDNIIGYWKAMVGRIDKESMQAWAEFLDTKLNQGVEPQKIKEAIDRIGGRDQTFKTPNLAQLKKELGGVGENNKFHCRNCNGHALVVVFNQIQGYKKQMILSPTSSSKMPLNRGEFWASVAPCVCQDGNNSQWNQFGYCVFGVATPNPNSSEVDGFTKAKEYIAEIKLQERHRER